MGKKLDELIKSINKEQKEEIMTRGLTNYEQFKRIPFTSPRMNYCTYGGIPEGRLIEFYGEESGGKTTSALDIVANFQNMYPDKDVLWVDSENTFDVEWARKLGVDVDRLYIIQPKSQSAEELFQMILVMIESEEVGLVIIDSLAALMSAQEIEKEIGDATYAGIAGPLTKFSKKAETACHKYHCTLIGINQEREDLKSQWGGMKTPGGKCWKFMCTMRLHFSKGKYIDDKGNELTRGAENPYGNIVLMSITKTKSCPPSRRTGFYTLTYSDGIDYIHDLIDVAIKYNIVEKSGAWYKIVDIESGEVINDKLQGMSKVKDALSCDDNLLKYVEELVDHAMNIALDNASIN